MEGPPNPYQPSPAKDRDLSDTPQSIVMKRAKDIAILHHRPHTVIGDYEFLYGLSCDAYLKSLLREKKIDVTDFRIHLQDRIVMDATITTDAIEITQSVAQTLTTASALAAAQQEEVSGRHLFEAFIRNTESPAVGFLTSVLREREK